MYPGLLWDHRNGRTNTLDLYITFDDGPVPEITDFVLETLEKYQAKATFFCVGENIQKHPQVYEALLAHKHTTGNHTYNHLNGWKTADDIYVKNIRRCEAVMQQKAGEKKLFRPPYGKIKRSQIRQISNEYQIVMWHLLSGDFDPNFNAEKCLKKCIAHSQSGTIIIFHDSHKAEKNLKYVLPRYLDHFAGAGYRFLSL